MQPEVSTYFVGQSGEIELALRQLLTAREATSDKLRRQILTVQIRELKDKLIESSSHQPEKRTPQVNIENDSGLFEGEIGRIESQLRDCFIRKSVSMVESHRNSIQREINALVDLLKSPIIHDNEAHSIDSRRLWDMVRAQNLCALGWVDPVIIRTLRDPVTHHSALHKAAILGNVDLIELLVSTKGCDINAVCVAGKTPLHIAVQLENVEVARKLLELGADRSIPDIAGKTPLSGIPKFILDQIVCLDESSASAQPESDWEMDPSELDYGEVIGDGATATVYRGCLGSKPVAIKEFNAIQRSDFNREVQILMKLHHPNLVCFIAATSRDKLRLVMELCAGGSLYELLHDRHVSLSVTQIIDICKGTLDGLAYLHSHGILHMDLKSGNLLFETVFSPKCETPTIKIADFGISRTTSCTHRPVQKIGGTWFWMSPETLLGDLDEISPKSDIFSFAVCLFEMLSGELPYASVEGLEMLPPVAVAIKVANGFRPDVARIRRLEPKIAALIDLMKRSWSYEPVERQTASVLSHELESMQESSR